MVHLTIKSDISNRVAHVIFYPFHVLNIFTIIFWTQYYYVCVQNCQILYPFFLFCGTKPYSSECLLFVVLCIWSYLWSLFIVEMYRWMGSIRSKNSEIFNYIFFEIRFKQTNTQLSARSSRLLFLSVYRLSSLPDIRLIVVSNL